jgi:hypothetical protein
MVAQHAGVDALLSAVSLRQRHIIAPLPLGAYRAPSVGKAGLAVGVAADRHRLALEHRGGQNAGGEGDAGRTKSQTTGRLPVFARPVRRSGQAVPAPVAT